MGRNGHKDVGQTKVVQEYGKGLLNGFRADD
jgi:hypothetical protein